MISLTEENYLKAVYHLIQLHGEANVNDIGKSLGIKMPTVNSMVKRLASKGLVRYESYRPLTLTPEGTRIATSIIRKHRLTEMYLVQKMGFHWDEVHHIAEQIEHIDSPVFFEKMDELLGFPSVDPHGSPIPDSDGHIVDQGYTMLSNCEVGEQVLFQAVKNSSLELLRYLTACGLTIGSKVTITHVEPFDNSMRLSYQDRVDQTFSKTVCDCLLVTR